MDLERANYQTTTPSGFRVYPSSSEEHSSNEQVAPTQQTVLPANNVLFRRPAGRAHAGGGIELCELHVLRSHAVEIRRADGGVPEAAQIAVAEIVAVDDNDVGGCFVSGCCVHE